MNSIPISETTSQVVQSAGRPSGAGHAMPPTPSTCERLGQKAAIALYILVTAVVCLAWLEQSGAAQTKPSPSFWTGRLEVTVLRCDQKCGNYEVNDKAIVSHDENAVVNRYSYEVYQNDKGIVARKLVSANTSGISEEGRGMQIVNYPPGYVLAFDKNSSQALRLPLVFPNASSTTLGSREILGFKCTGVERRWVQQRNQFRRMRKTWTATKSDFKDPLFQEDYGFDPSNRLVYVEVGAMRSLKVSPPLEPSLFELPKGYRVIQVNP